MTFTNYNCSSLYEDFFKMVVNTMQQNKVSEIALKDTEWGKLSGWERIFIKNDILFYSFCVNTTRFDIEITQDSIHRLDLHSLLKTITIYLNDKLIKEI